MTLSPERLEEIEEGLTHFGCPFCGNAPHERIDVGMGTVAGPVTCCDTGVWFYGGHSEDEAELVEDVNKALCDSRDETWHFISEVKRLKERVGELEGALGCFLDDDRFVVSVGGNPNVVERMIEDARAALSKGEG